MNNLTLIIIATVGYTGFQFFSAKAGGKIDGGLVPIIVNLCGVIIPTSFLLTKILNKSALLATQKSGFMYSLLAGVSIAVFALAFQKIFQQGGNLSYVSPIIFGGAIALATILSIVFLKESLSLYHALGVVLVLSGLVLISIGKTQ